ncbi:MAG: GTPase domain-containing protein [Veillonellaceae bacterium]|jgi:50S ribosomal subunit-associated GTPase HflX|nr:GTPase domain-containing protein [Veillonellaceae bacterium]
MREFVIVGKPNCGKTMFALNFAGYLGSKTIDMTFRTYDGLMTCRHFTLEEAKHELCGMTLHKTKSLQTVVLRMSLGKTMVNFKLTDTCGLISQIHPDEAVRRGMAQTIDWIRSCDYVFHIVDITAFSVKPEDNSNNIDIEVYNYGKSRHNYALLANKIDLPSAKANLPRVIATFPNTLVIPISGLKGTGFKEVKACVARNI